MQIGFPASKLPDTTTSFWILFTRDRTAECALGFGGGGGGRGVKGGCSPEASGVNCLSSETLLWCTCGRSRQGTSKSRLSLAKRMYFSEWSETKTVIQGNGGSVDLSCSRP